jgi:hypothetical protein
MSVSGVSLNKGVYADRTDQHNWRLLTIKLPTSTSRAQFGPLKFNNFTVSYNSEIVAALLYQLLTGFKHRIVCPEKRCPG